MINNKTNIVIDDLCIKFARKKIKNINIRVINSGEIRASAPFMISDQYILEFIKSKIPWIREKQEHFKTKNQDSWLPEDITFHKLQMQSKILLLLDKWQKIIGVSVNRCTIKLMNTRWGSCNYHKKYININLKLVHKPQECLEYVLVHELIHIIEPSHNKNFYRLLKKYMPKWQMYDKTLKSNIIL